MSSSIIYNKNKNSSSLEKLLQRLNRHFSSSTNRPPDAASDRLGRDVARCALSPSDLEVVYKALIRAAESSRLPSSVPYAVLDEITDRMKNGDMMLHSFEFLTEWLLQTEHLYRENNTNSSLRHLLSACIRAVAAYLVTQNENNSSSSSSLHSSSSSIKSNKHQQQRQQQRQCQQQVMVDTYRRLQLDSSKSLLVQRVLQSTTNLKILSPLFAVSVLSPSAKHREATLHLFWRTLFREDQGLQVLKALQWMTVGLDIHLNTILLTSSKSSSPSSPENDLTLALEWWTLLVNNPLALDSLDLAPLLFRLAPACVLYGASLPLFSDTTTSPLLSSPSSPSSSSAIIQLCGCYPLQNPTTTLRWVTMTLSTASARDRRHWLQALLEAISSKQTAAAATSSPCSPTEEADIQRQQQQHHWICVLLVHALAVICSEMEECSSVAVVLMDQVAKLEKTSLGAPSCSNNSDAHNNLSNKAAAMTECLIQLLEQQQGGGNSKNDKDDDSSNKLIQALAARGFDPTSATLTEAQQLASLLFGVVLLERDDNDDNGEKKPEGATFLSNLLKFYPSLAIFLLPIVLDRVHSASQSGGGKRLLRYLEFLCEVLVHDVHCAVEIWKVLTQLLSPNMPLAVRVTAIRLLPLLVKSNKRMYRRSIDVLGITITNSSRIVELRLAVAATLADLAQTDCISDAADVIGCIQGFLIEEIAVSPMHALVVHYGILCLHHLVVAGDLTFDVVIKVLNKRLLSSGATNLESIVVLPEVVLEALVILLGDGDGDEDFSEEGNSELDTNESGAKKTPSVRIISPQVTNSVRTLIRLGAKMVAQQQNQPWSPTQVRVVQNIFKSLAGYSLDALGLTEEGVKSVMSYFDENSSEHMSMSEPGERYISLRNLVIAGMTTLYDSPLVTDDTGDKSEYFEAVVALTRKLLEFEEETIGSGLWRKKGRTGNNGRSPTSTGSAKSALSGRLERSVLTILPEPTKVQQLASERPPSPGASIALLLSSDGSQLSVIRDNGDATLDTSDPLFIVFALQAYLHAAASIVSRHRREDVGKIIDEVASWYEVFVSPDTMYMSLAALCIYIPFDLPAEGSSQSTCAEKTASMVLHAYNNNRFEKEDIAKICLGLIAVSSLRSGLLEQATTIVDTLEQSVRGYGGRKCFGAYYGMGLVSQGLRRYLDSGTFRLVVPEAKRMIFRICGFVVEEILTCYEERSDIFLNLVACLKSGVATSDLVESLSELDAGSLTLLMTKQVKARYLFISCAMCLPALSTLNGALHLAALRLLEAFEWGGGKGIALPPMLRACEHSGLFEAEELKQIYTSFAQTFEERMDSQDTGIDSEGLDDIFYAFNGTTTNTTSHIIRRTLVGNRDLFDDDGCVLSLIAMAVSIAPVPCLGATYFAIPADVREEAGKSDVESVVEIVRDAATSEVENKYSEMALILMAFLSSMKNPRDLSAVAYSLPTDQEKSVSSKEKVGASGIDLEKVPSPHAETVLAGVLEQLEQFDLKPGNREFYLTKMMSALECLCLPDGFAKSFIDPLLRVSRGNVALGCVSLLCSQLCGRRSAVFGGRDFILLALKLASMSKEDWDNLGTVGEAFRVFVVSLADITKRFPPESTEQVLEKLWRNAFSSLPGDHDLVLKFLSSTKRLLTFSALAPKTAKSIRHLVGRVSRDLPDIPLELLLRPVGEKAPSIFESYVQCLSMMSQEILDEDEVLNLKLFDGFDVECVRVMALIELVESDFFDSSTTGREALELTNAASWVSKKLQLYNDQVNQYALRQVMLSLAKATMRESSAYKKERISSLLDVLLLTKKATSRIAIQWLSVMLAHWSPRCGSDGQLTLGFLCVGDARLAQGLPARALERSFEILFQDLPLNLATFTAREKISASVCNQLIRLHETWSEQKVDRDILDCLRCTIFACNGNSSNDEAFVSLCSTVLVTSH